MEIVQACLKHLHSNVNLVDRRLGLSELLNRTTQRLERAGPELDSPSCPRDLLVVTAVVAVRSNRPVIIIEGLNLIFHLIVEGALNRDLILDSVPFFSSVSAMIVGKPAVWVILEGLCNVMQSDNLETPIQMKAVSCVAAICNDTRLPLSGTILTTTVQSCFNLALVSTCTGVQGRARQVLRAALRDRVVRPVTSSSCSPNDFEGEKHSSSSSQQQQQQHHIEFEVPMFMMRSTKVHRPDLDEDPVDYLSDFSVFRTPRFQSVVSTIMSAPSSTVAFGLSSGQPSFSSPASATSASGGDGNNNNNNIINNLTSPVSLSSPTFGFSTTHYHIHQRDIVNILESFLSLASHSISASVKSPDDIEVRTRQLALDCITCVLLDFPDNGTNQEKSVVSPILVAVEQSLWECVGANIATTAPSSFFVSAVHILTILTTRAHYALFPGLRKFFERVLFPLVKSRYSTLEQKIGLLSVVRSIFSRPGLLIAYFCNYDCLAPPKHDIGFLQFIVHGVVETAFLDYTSDSDSPCTGSNVWVMLSGLQQASLRCECLSLVGMFVEALWRWLEEPVPLPRGKTTLTTAAIQSAFEKSDQTQNQKGKTGGGVNLSGPLFPSLPPSASSLLQLAEKPSATSAAAAAAGGGGEKGTTINSSPDVTPNKQQESSSSSHLRLSSSVTALQLPPPTPPSSDEKNNNNNNQQKSKQQQQQQQHSPITNNTPDQTPAASSVTTPLTSNVDANQAAAAAAGGGGGGEKEGEHEGEENNNNNDNLNDSTAGNNNNESAFYAEPEMESDVFYHWKHLHHSLVNKMIELEARLKFDISWKQGRQFLIEKNVISEDPKDFAIWIKNTPRLKRTQIGTIFEKMLRDSICEQIVRAYISSFDFKHIYVDEALRSFLISLMSDETIPKFEGQIWEKLMALFADEYFEQNQNDPDEACNLTVDDVDSVANAVFFLHSTYHNASVKDKMGCSSYARDAAEMVKKKLPESYWRGTYQRVTRRPWQPDDSHVSEIDSASEWRAQHWGAVPSKNAGAQLWGGNMASHSEYFGSLRFAEQLQLRYIQRASECFASFMGACGGSLAAVRADTPQAAYCSPHYAAHVRMILRLTYPMIAAAAILGNKLCFSGPHITLAQTLNHHILPLMSLFGIDFADPAVRVGVSKIFQKMLQQEHTTKTAFAGHPGVALLSTSSFI